MSDHILKEINCPLFDFYLSMDKLSPEKLISIYYPHSISIIANINVKNSDNASTLETKSTSKSKEVKDLLSLPILPSGFISAQWSTTLLFFLSSLANK